MNTEKRLKVVIQLEKDLHTTRHQILKEDAALLALEKNLFQTEHHLEKNLLREFDRTDALEEKTRQETVSIKKSLTKKIRKLGVKTKVQKLSNAVVEQQLLQRQLQSLQNGFKKELVQMGKRKK
ncbi:hypothetical protein KKE06_04130 [Candidatus Micrarchaeota archaeon]|nr:hypothetical protein [Candidatus Micrarchaeota archaeon]